MSVTIEKKVKKEIELEIDQQMLQDMIHYYLQAEYNTDLDDGDLAKFQAHVRLPFGECLDIGDGNPIHVNLTLEVEQ